MKQAHRKAGMFMRVTLRTAGEGALGIMARIHMLSWQAAYKGLLPDYVLAGFCERRRVDLFRNAMRTRPIEFYLLLADETPAGMAALHITPGAVEAEVGSFYFLPEYWGKGVAGKAMELLLETLRARGMESAFVWVFEQNPRARRFYEKCGFVLTGEEKTLNIGVPVPEVRYFQRLEVRTCCICEK